jgi:hypothetical protein
MKKYRRTETYSHLPQLMRDGSGKRRGNEETTRRLIADIVGVGCEQRVVRNKGRKRARAMEFWVMMVVVVANQSRPARDSLFNADLAHTAARPNLRGHGSDSPPFLIIFLQLFLRP